MFNNYVSLPEGSCKSTTETPLKSVGYTDENIAGRKHHMKEMNNDEYVGCKCYHGRYIDRDTMNYLKFMDVYGTLW